ncbi:unnamed protein product [Periconia digitata]|uniref:Cytochrome P450 n=1 Tax=Periconia digitata TaxID=1303443 RepID=A0A9W4U3L2_9PLEO|nr:unnamed protein product [Periconia digitata]
MMMNSTYLPLWWEAAGLTLAIYSLGLAFYRLFLHPLARFPGPKLAAITRWYEAYYDLILDGQYTFKIAELHKTYGPIIRISPHELHVIDPAFYEKLYCQEGRWDKYQWACNGFLAEGATICTSVHELHQARRAPLNHFFSKAKVAARQEIIIRHVEKLCNRIEGFVGGTVNLGAACSALIHDAHCEFVINRVNGSLDKEDFNSALAGMCLNVGFLWRVGKHFHKISLALKRIPLDFVAKLSNEDVRIFFDFLQGVDRDTEALLKSATSPSAKQDAGPRTVVHEIAESNLDPSDKELSRLLNEVQTVVAAGLETVSSVMRVTFYHVFSNPEILRRLREELKTVGTDTSPGGNMLELKQLERLPYMTAIIMEALRLSPGIATRMGRMLHDKDLVYDKWCIPAGTPVGMTTILMHTDETLYPDPFTFNPDRWMDLEKRKTAGKTFAPFSRGSRMCVGFHLAWADLYISLAALATRFDFEFQNTQSSDFKVLRDDFVVGTKCGSTLTCHVSLHET